MSNTRWITAVRLLRESNASGNGWAGAIFPYCKIVGVYKCPKDDTKGSHISYAENRRMVGQNLTFLGTPADTVEFYETTTPNCDPSTPETVSLAGLLAPQNSTRHDADTFGLNYAAVDGHVKYLMPEQVSSGLGALPARTISAGHSRPVVLTFAVK